MDHFEVDGILKTFRIIADTREQRTSRAAERFEAFGCPVERATLSYGDYAANATLPDGKDLVDVKETIKAPCVVERKMSLDELAMCFTRGRDRFEREFDRARESGARVYLLVENASWEKLMNHRYRSALNPKAFLASMTAWVARYELIPIFVKAESSGKMIREILYRELKERLKDG